MINDLRYRFRALFHKEEMDRELEDELRFHEDQQIRKSVVAGVRAEAAARRIRLDGALLAREDCRDARGVRLIENLGRDLGYAWRVLAKSKGFAAVAIMILALGIGANTAAFSFVDAVLLKRLPVERPEELVMLQYTMRAGEYVGHGRLLRGFGYPVFREIEQHNDVFAGMVGSGGMLFHFSSGGTPARVYGSIVSGNYFSTLGVHAALGRTLTPDDNGAEGAHPVCVVSWEFWRDRLGGDPLAIGQTVRLDAHPFQIVGVMQPGFRGISLQERSDLFVPMSMTEMFLGMKRDDTGYTWFGAMARLKPSVTLARATAAYDALLREQRPNWRGVLTPASQGVGGDREIFGTPALISLAAVGIVLAIACANLAGLFLARASTRGHELAVRLSLGATRGRLAQQLLMECALLGVAGCAASLAVSAALMNVLKYFLESPQSRLSLQVGLDPTVLAFTAALTMATALSVGLLPAWQASRVDLNAGLKMRPDGIGGSALWMRQGLLVFQLALGMALLFGAGVLTHTLRQLQTADLGLDAERVVTLSVEPGKGGYSDAAAAEFYQRLLEQARRIPGVTSAALSEIEVFSGNMFAGIVRVSGYTRRREEPNNNYNAVSSGYFRTMGTPLVAGRDFTDSDREGAPAVAIVNEQFVKHYWPGQNAIGRHIGLSWRADAEIVGVVKTARYRTVREDPQIIVYVPLLQKPLYPATFVARTMANPKSTLAALSRLARSIDPQLPATAETVLAARDATISRERLLAFLSTFLACLAAALVGIGLYGWIAYTAAARTKEIGLRMALGARPGSVAWMFVRRALLLAGLGIAIGAPVSLACARFLKSIVFGVTPQDPVAAIGACLAMGSIAGAAALWPAKNAARRDPMVSLREE